MVVQVSFVGMTEEAAKDTAKKGGYEKAVKTVKTSFKANSKVQPLHRQAFTLLFKGPLHF